MRYAARTDGTQTSIVDALRKFGASVWVIGLPVDLLVGFTPAGGQPRTILVECKSLTGKKAPKPARYTHLQTAFMEQWKGSPVVTVTDAEGAIAALRQ